MLRFLKSEHVVALDAIYLFYFFNRNFILT